MGDWGVSPAELVGAGLPAPVIIVATVVGLAFVLGVVVDLVKLGVLAAAPGAQQARWWRFAVRACSVVLGGVGGWVLVQGAPLWGVVIGVVVGGCNASIRAAVKMQIKRRLDPGGTGAGGDL